MTYQLMKTTPYLGGQVRIDLVSDRIAGDSSLLLDEVHVVPLSDRIWYSSKENQINNRHTDNVVELYKATQDSFYKCLGDIRLENKYPNYTEGVVEDLCDHTYQMGLKRISRARYDKELSFLLPMWIDSAEDMGNIDFFVHVDAILCNELDENNRNEITSKKFTMSPRMRKYLTDYFDGVNQDLMYVGIRDQSSYITGLEVSSGAFLTKDVSRIIPDLLGRERPLLETDNMLVRQFSESKMVARQLVNFNLIFSINDLFEATIEQTMHWAQMNIWCEARLKTYSGYKDIPLKDIYTNYTDIYPYKISDNPLVPGKFVMYRNALDYLQDYKNIDMIHTNKLLQPNFHWSVRDNSKYTWNLYNGFSPLVEDEDGTLSIVAGRFFGTPDIFTEEYSVNANNIQWIKILNGTDTPVPGNFVGVYMNPGSATRFTPNRYGTCWSENGIKYNIGDTLSTGIIVNEPEYTQVTSDDMYASISVLRDNLVDSLSPDKIYCAVYRRKMGNDLKDFVSIVYIVPTDVDIQEYGYLDKMTFQGVRRILGGSLPRATQAEIMDIFSTVSNDDTGDVLAPGEFYDLFVCYDSAWDSEPESEEPEEPDFPGTTIHRDEPEPEEQEPEPEPEPEPDSLDTIKARTIARLFGKVLGTVEYPNIIRFDKSIGFRPAAAPSVDHLIEEKPDIGAIMDVSYASEIEYEKIDDNYISYLYRYDGNIIPQFIDPELPDSTTDNAGNALVDSGAFNTTWRKLMYSELSPGEVECMNYINKQHIFQPDYPSLKYYYEVEKKVSLEEPNLPDDYHGEICWFRANKVYYTDTDFTIVENGEDHEGITSEEMNEEKVKEMFVSYISSKGAFATMDNSEEVILEALWPRYAYDSDWEYHSLTDTDKYDFTVNFHLR